jgi:putative ABC transport system permease protein
MAVGLGLGVPLSKLMLNAMSKMLGVTSPIRFIVVIPAVLWTSGLFLLLFVFIGTITTLQISPRKVVRLLREHQRPKVFPRYSRWVAILSLLLIGGGCGTAWFVDGRTLVPAMLPVTAVVSLGTFLFFAQASVGILMYLKKKTTFLYRNLNLLTISDLIFRMKENARVLAAVAVLSACVITATGTIYTAEATFLQDVARAHPQALTFAARGETAPETIASRVREILREDSIEVTEEIVLEGLVTPSQAENGTLLIPETNFNKWAESSGAQRLSLEENEAAYLVPMVGEPNGETVPMEVVYGGETYTINTRTWPFPRTNYLSSMNRLMVVDDTLFESLAKGAADGDLAVFAGYEFDNWRDSLDAIKRIRSFLEAEAPFGPEVQGGVLRRQKADDGAYGYDRPLRNRALLHRLRKYALFPAVQRDRGRPGKVRHHGKTGGIETRHRNRGQQAAIGVLFRSHRGGIGPLRFRDEVPVQRAER